MKRNQIKTKKNLDLKNQRSEIVNTPKYVETFKEEIIVTPDEIIVEEEYIDQDNSQELSVL